MGGCPSSGTGLKYFLAFQNSPNLFERGFQISLWKFDISKAVNVRKPRALFLQEDDRSLEAKATLEQSDLVNHILAGMRGVDPRASLQPS